MVASFGRWIAVRDHATRGRQAEMATMQLLLALRSHTHYESVLVGKSEAKKMEMRAVAPTST